MTKDDKQFFKGFFAELKKDQKEDRRFFTGLFKGLENRFDNLEGRFDILEEQVGKNYEAIQKNSDLIQKNSDEIRYNGILIERVQDDIQLLAEGHATLHTRIIRLENPAF